MSFLTAGRIEIPEYKVHAGKSLAAHRQMQTYKLPRVEMLTDSMSWKPLETHSTCYRCNRGLYQKPPQYAAATECAVACEHQDRLCLQ